MLASLTITLAKLLVAIALFVPGPVPAFGQSIPGLSKPQMFIEDASPANLPRTVEIFQEEARAAGWSLLAVHNMAGILSARGYTLHPVLIIEVCSGKYSAELLGRDETRYVASMIPCRVAIYQTSAGQVVISRMNTSMFAGMMEAAVADVIRKSGEEMEAIIAKTLMRLK